MKRLQTKVMNTPVGFSDTSGIARAGQIHTKSMEGGLAIADEIFGFAEKNLTVQRKQEAAADAAVVDFHTDPVTGMPEIPETPHTWTIYGDEYQKQVVNRYANRIENDLATTITQKAVEFPTDPTGFQEWVGEYIKETALQTDPRARPAVEAYGRDIARRALGGIVSRKAEQDRIGAGKEEVLSLQRLEVEATAVAGTKNFEEKFSKLTDKVRQSKFAYPTTGTQNAYLHAFRRSAALSAGIRGLFGIEDDDKEFHPDEQDSLQRLKERRDEAIANFGKRKGELYSEFIKKSNLSDKEILEIQGIFNSLNTKIDSMHAANQKAIMAMSAKKFFHTYTTKYGRLQLDEWGVTDELIESSPSVALSRMMTAERNHLTRTTREETTRRRNEYEDSMNIMHQYIISSAQRDALSFPPEILAEWKEETARIESHGDLRLSEKAKLYSKVLTKITKKLTALVSVAQDQEPFENALRTYRSPDNVTGRGARGLRQNQKNAEIAESHFRTTIINEPYSQQGYDNEGVIQAALDYTNATGVVPAGLGNHIASLAGSPTAEDVAKAAVLMDRLRDVTGIEESSLGLALGTSGNKIVSALEVFQANGGTYAGANESGQALEIYKKIMAGESHDFEAAVRAALHTDKKEQDEKLNELFRKNYDAQFSPGMLSKWGNRLAYLGSGWMAMNPNYNEESAKSLEKFYGENFQKSMSEENTPLHGAFFKKAVMETFFALAPSKRDGSYDAPMKRAIEIVMNNGNYGASIAAARPHGIHSDSLNYFIAKNAPETRLSSSDGEGGLGLKLLQEKINTIWQNNPMYKDMKNKPELKFGKNMYVRWVRDNPDGSPVYSVSMVTETTDIQLSRMVKVGGNSHITTHLIETSDIIDSVNEGWLKRKAAEKKKIDQERRIRLEELKDAKNRAGRNPAN